MSVRAAHSPGQAEDTQEVDEEQLNIVEKQHQETRVSRTEDNKYPGELVVCSALIRSSKKRDVGRDVWARCFLSICFICICFIQTLRL